MSEPEPEDESAPKKKGGLKGLLFGLLGAVLLGGGGFYATWSGLISLPLKSGDSGHESPVSEVAFVALDPIIVTIFGQDGAQQLRVTVQLDVPPEVVEEVTAVSPRVVDALNTFLRAVGQRDLADVSVFPRLQSQMLRRARVIVGEDKINDLLVTEFILN